MKKMNILYYFLYVLIMSSCYKDYIEDYDYSTTYFASQKPLRTVIADRDMQIRVGVAIGGKRKVNMNDWAEFEIDPTLLDGTGLELLPEKYYTLSDENMFHVTKNTLAVADVGISFTDDFYNDDICTKVHYALPLKLRTSSLDKFLEGKDYSIVAIKYISTYHGTYYIKGKVSELSETGEIINTETYGNADLSKNDVRMVNTLTRNVLLRQGVGNSVVTETENVKLTFQNNHTLKVETAEGGIEIMDGSGTFDDSKENLEISLEYCYTKSGKKYKVEETLIRRQDPLKDLRFEEW